MSHFSGIFDSGITTLLGTKWLSTFPYCQSRSSFSCHSAILKYRPLVSTYHPHISSIRPHLLLWKLWILQSCLWKTRHGLTISGTSKQERLILISLQTLIRSFIYPFEEQLLTVTFLVTDSHRLLTQCYDSELLTRSNCDRNSRQPCILSSPPVRGSC